MISVDRLKPALWNYVQAGVVRQVSNTIEASAQPETGSVSQAVEANVHTGAGTNPIAKSGANSLLRAALPLQSIRPPDVRCGLRSSLVKDKSHEESHNLWGNVCCLRSDPGRSPASHDRARSERDSASPGCDVNAGDAGGGQATQPPGNARRVDDEQWAKGHDRRSMEAAPRGDATNPRVLRRRPGSSTAAQCEREGNQFGDRTRGRGQIPSRSPDLWSRGKTRVRHRHVHAGERRTVPGDYPAKRYSPWRDGVAAPRARA